MRHVKYAMSLFFVMSLACTVNLAPIQQVVTISRSDTPALNAVPTPPVDDMTVSGNVRLRSAPDNTGSQTLAIVPQGAIFHVQRRTTVHSTDWAYGSWYDGEKWMVGYVAARFLR